MLKKLFSVFIILFPAALYAQKKVISLSLASDEILEELQKYCPQQVEILSFSLLVDDESMSFVKADSRKKVTTRSDANIEQWVRLKPDVIFASSFNKKETLEKLSRFKLVHKVLKPVVSIAAIKENINIIGDGIDCQIGADKIIQEMDKAIAKMKPLAVPTKGIMYFGKNVVIGKNTVPNEIFTLTGAINLAVAADLFDWPTVSSEWLFKIKPSHIIVFEQRSYNEVKGSAFLSSSTRLSLMDGRALFSASQHVVESLNPLRKILTN